MSSGRFRVRGCHPLWPRFPARSAIVLSPHCRRSYNPARCLDTRGLGSCAFARHYWRNHCYFLFLRVLRCFSSPRSLYTKGAVTVSLPPGSPIRTSADHGAFASPRGFSQLITSFIASESHRHPPCALSCFLVSFAYMTLLLQVRSILVFTEKVCFNFLGESLYSFCNSSFAFPACQ